MIVFRTHVLVAAVAGALLLAGCASAPKAIVQDLDTYQVVDIGDVHYVTPDGITVTDKGRGFATHELRNLPGVKATVAVDANPPRDFRLDGDVEGRRFVRDLPGGQLTSVQFYELEGRQHLKILAKGTQKDGSGLFGTVVMIREGSKTAAVRATGPVGNRAEIDRLAEDISKRIELREKTPAKKTVAEKKKDEPKDEKKS